MTDINPRCQACDHTVLDHEDEGWVCDCTQCPWKPQPLFPALDRESKAFLEQNRRLALVRQDLNIIEVAYRYFGSGLTMWVAADGWTVCINGTLSDPLADFDAVIHYIAGRMPA